MNSKELLPEIEAFNQEWGNAVAAGELHKIESFLTDTPLFLGEGKKLVRGREAVMNEVTAELDDGVTQKHFSIVEAFAAGDLAYQVGTFEIEYANDDGTSRSEQGKYIDILKRGPDGAWKLHLSANNTSRGDAK